MKELFDDQKDATKKESLEKELKQLESTFMARKKSATKPMPKSGHSSKGGLD